MNKKKIVVCGATGFIGRNVAEYFAALGKYEVVGVCHKRPSYKCSGLKWIQADLTKSEELEKAIQGADIIVQAAATTSGSKDVVNRPYIHVADNAVINSLLFRSAFDNKIPHLIFFSCTVMLHSSEKGLTEEGFDANVPINPRYFGIAWTKLYLEKMAEFYSGIGPTKYTVIRHSNVYGPYDKFDLERSHVFGATVTKVLTAPDNEIVVWGNGEEARDLLYVGDLVDFVNRAIENQAQAYGLYNCGYGKAITIKDLVQKIIDKSGRKLAIKYDLSQPTMKTSLFLNCAKALNELGWSPKTALDDGIFKTLEWWKVNRGKPALDEIEN
jgi:GDP-L-fucose synthase